MRIFTILFPLLISGFFWSCSAEDRQTVRQSQQKAPLIAAVGDSITLGVLSTCGGYPTLLQARLKSEGFAFEMRNLGISGEKAHQTRQRFAAILDEADLVLLMIGFNDLTRPEECPAPLGCRTLEYIETMVGMAEKRGIPIILGTITPAQPGNLRDWANPAIMDLNRQLTDLAARKRITLADTHQVLWDNRAKAVFSDHAHPNDRGYALLAETWRDALHRCGLFFRR
jgi:lysophospholipase L1-like esterase